MLPARLGGVEVALCEYVARNECERGGHEGGVERGAKTHRSRGRGPANARARDTAVSASLWSYLEMGGVQGANTRPANDAIAELAAQRRLHARHACFERPRHEHGGRRARRGADWRAPSYGTLCMRRTSKRISSHSTTCDGMHDESRKRLCEHAGRARTVPVMAKKGRPTPVCQSWGLLTIKLFKVSRILVFWPASKKTKARGLSAERARKRSRSRFECRGVTGVRKVVGHRVVLGVVLEPAERVGVSACGRVV